MLFEFNMLDNYVVGTKNSLAPKYARFVVDEAEQ